jgi:hypothetical protein
VAFPFCDFNGKLKGKALLMFDPAPLTLHTRPDAQPSPTDEEILARGGARGGGRFCSNSSQWSSGGAPEEMVQQPAPLARPRSDLIDHAVLSN